MIVDSLSLKGFLGYHRRCDLDFQGRKTIGIAGANESGKSSLLRAITYAAYGQVPTPQGAIREVQLVNDAADGLIVEVQLTLPDGSQLCIERGRTKKNEPVLRASGIGKAKPTKVEEYISDRLGLTYEDFIALSYFVQGDIHQFMSGSKRAYFQRWTAGLRLWQTYEQTASDKVNSQEADIRKCRTDFEQAQARAGRLSELQVEAKAARGSAREAERKAQLLNEQVQGLTGALSASEAAEDLKQAFDSLRAQLSRQGSQLDGIKRRISILQVEMKKIRSGVCPLLPGDVHCEELSAEGAEKRAQINTELRDLRSQGKELQGERQNTSTQLEVLKAKLQESMAPIAQTRRQLQLAKSDLVTANRELRRELDRQSRVAVALESATAAKSEAKELKAELATMEREMRRWQFLRFMCGRSGIPAMLIEGELERVEDRCNWVLDRLDYHKRIKFSGYKELASYEKVCGVCGSESWAKGACRSCGAPRPHKRKDEPTVTVLEGNSERPFALESGGAQILQSFAVRLSSGLFVSGMTGVPMQMVMLDEVFSFLDSVNRQKLMGLVVGKLETEFGLRQQFVVSHQADVINTVEGMIRVSKRRGSSVAEWM